MHIITMIVTHDKNKDFKKIAILKVRDKDMEGFVRTTTQAYCQGEPIIKDMADIEEGELIKI